MKATLFLHFLTISFVFIYNINAQCERTLNCLHGGEFDTTTCKCTCFKSYLGDECEFANCQIQDDKCGTLFKTADCNNQLIVDYCPAMCNALICKCGGFDSCTNGGVLDMNACQCRCPNGFSGKRCETPSVNMTTKLPCPITFCLNNGRLNLDLCKCECPPSFGGSICEVVLTDPDFCKSLISLEMVCLIPEIKNNCPTTCAGIPATSQFTTVVTSTVSVLSTITQKSCQLDCFNGGKLNIDTCECDCRNTGFKGFLCQAPDCDVAESSGCNGLTPSICASSPILKARCPFSCGLCIRTTTITPPITSIISTTSLTTTISMDGCQLTCLNGGKLDTIACSCDCTNTGFEGFLCQSPKCNVVETSDCEGLNPTICRNAPTLFDRCPFKCGLCTYSSTISPESTAFTTFISSQPSTSQLVISTMLPTTLSVTTAKSCSLNCLNGGKLNLEPCGCDCTNTGFSGVLCQIAKCDVIETSDCDDLTPDLCEESPELKTKCPKKCGLCPSETTTVDPISSTLISTISLTTALDCQLNCLNGGKLSSTECKCDCPEWLSGLICQTAKCDVVETKDCNNLDKLTCDKNPELFKKCPKTCGLCPSSTVEPLSTTPDLSTIPVTTAAKCELSFCLNDGKLDLLNCVCDCTDTGYQGYVCQDAKCDGVKDDDECNGLTISNCLESPTLKSKCPFLCGLCSVSTTPSVSYVTTMPDITTPTTIKECRLNCLNGGIVNLNDCSCKCPDNFKGFICQSPICPTKDDDGCLGVTLDSCLASPSLKKLCPISCGLCPKTSALYLEELSNSDNQFCAFVSKSYQCHKESVQNSCPRKCNSLRIEE